MESLKLYATLHAHSTHSDGVYTPRELVKIAKAEGYSAMAVTDHDTVTANKELSDECKKAGLESIFGCEFSTKSKTTGLAYHITAFHFDPNEPQMKKYLDDLSEKETHQTRELFHRALKLGLIKGVSWQEVLDYNAGITWLCNEHVFRAMKDKGLITELDYEEFFEVCFGDHRDEIPPYCDFKSTEEVIELVHKAGGICCVAHPAGQLHTIPTLVALGIDGVEVWHNDVPNEEKREALRLAKEYDLYVSGGEDHHGLLGGQYERFDIPEECLYYAPSRSLGTTKLFYEEIRDKKKSPEREKLFEELLSNEALWTYKERKYRR